MQTVVHFGLLAADQIRKKSKNLVFFAFFTESKLARVKWALIYDPMTHCDVKLLKFLGLLKPPTSQGERMN